MYTALSSECRGWAVLRAGLGGWPCSRLCTPGLPLFCCLPWSSVFWNVTACSVLSCLRCGSPPPCPGSEGARQPGQRSAALPSTSTLSPFGMQDAARCMSRPTSPPPEPCLSPLLPVAAPHLVQSLAQSPLGTAPSLRVCLTANTAKRVSVSPATDPLSKSSPPLSPLPPQLLPMGLLSHGHHLWQASYLLCRTEAQTAS